MEILTVALASPFLLFLPGYFLTQVAFPRYDYIEKATLSVALSMLTVFLALFAVERTVGKLTPTNTFTTVTVVNLGAFLLCAVMRLWQRTHRK